MKLVVLPSLQAVAASAWDALVPADHPFVEHRFLSALERSGSVGPRTAWHPMHLVVVEEDVDVETELAAERPLHPIAAAPCYGKADSWGEFVFDWQWAEVYALQGKAYYPKLVCAVPFTPATGRRLLVDPDRPDAAALRRLLVEGLLALARGQQASGVHGLYLEAQDLEAFVGAGFVARSTLQLQFENLGDDGAPFADFDAFLGAMRSAARKGVRRERRIAAAHGMALQVEAGTDLSAAAWERVEQLYRIGCARYGSPPYLDAGMFAFFRQDFADRIRCSTARDAAGQICAMTLNFEKGEVLYGRYWGALQEWPMLHFELAYYQLIEDAIRRGLRRVEAGSGGGHKLRRGLQPTLCKSAHCLFDPELFPAIAGWIGREDRGLRQRAAALEGQGTRRRDAL